MKKKMSKHTLTLSFDLDEHEIEAYMALNGSKSFSVLWSIDQAMRSIVKYGSCADANIYAAEKMKSLDIIDKLRAYLYEKLNDENISFEGL